MVLWLVAPTPLVANELPPRPDGPVGDLADILPPADEARLDVLLRSFYAENCIALIVASIPSLEGQDIDSFGTRLARAWTVSDPGVLLLIAPNDRRTRIELSVAVNRVISDDAARKIIEDNLIPHFRVGNYVAGTFSAVNAVIARLNADRANDGLDRTTCHQPAEAA